MLIATVSGIADLQEIAVTEHHVEVEAPGRVAPTLVGLRRRGSEGISVLPLPILEPRHQR